MPLFSVIIATYNRSRVLSHAINSVLSQTFRDWELIIIDDGSTDDTVLLLEEFLIDSRIKFYSQVNVGVSSSRNTGSKIAIGKYLIFLDSDDFLLPNCLSQISSKMRENPDYFVWGVRLVSQNKVVEVIPKIDAYYSLLTGTYAIKRKVFLELKGFDEKLNFGENTELFHRAKIHHLSYRYLDFLGLVYNYNEYGGSKNLQNMIDSNLIILEKHNDTLSSHSKRLYHQVIGVNQLRFRRFTEARFHLWKAFSYNPWKFKTLARFAISLWPWLAKKFYSKKVKFQ